MSAILSTKTFSFLFLLCLCIVRIESSYAAVIERSAMNPNGPVCSPPRISCSGDCCASNYICSAGTCKPKPPPPPPPKPGNFSITYYEDRARHPGLIYIHGSGFTNGAAVTILEQYIDYSYNPPAHAENTVWSMNFPNVANFDYGTGIQDCSRHDVPGFGAWGETAVLRVMDWALNKFTYEIPLRAQWGGLCTGATG